MFCSLLSNMASAILGFERSLIFKLKNFQHKFAVCFGEVVSLFTVFSGVLNRV